MHKSTFIFVAAALLSLPATSAFAQDAAKISIAPKTCQPPEELPRVEPLKSQVKLFDKQAEEYKKCMQSYAESEGAISKAHNEAAQGAIDEYNAWADKRNADLKAKSGE